MASTSWLPSWGFEHDGSLPTPEHAYIHVPFCEHRCSYCNFTLIAGRQDLIPRYLEALAQELSHLGRPFPVKTLFIGGGTPTVLGSQQWKELGQLLHRWLPLENHGEFSVEANPIHVDDSLCHLLRSIGVNRISIGGQSFQVEKLQRLDRDHTPEQLQRAIEIAKRYFDNVSLDLIFGAPDESLEDWKSDLAQATSHGIQHLSTYGLTIEKGARFFGMLQNGQIHALEDEIELQMYQQARVVLTNAGFEHYEVSNFALPGFRCQHNEAYWLNRRWWAFGPGAARFVGRVRSTNHRSTTQYLRLIANGSCPSHERDLLSDEQILRDQFVFGMRRLEGIAWLEFRNAFSPPLRETFERSIATMIDWGLFQTHENRLQLTEKGLVVSDSIWPYFL